MKFDYCIGNPPYQANGSNAKYYPYFYLAGQAIAHCVEMIFPSTWQEYKTANGLQLLNTPNVKEDRRIVFIDNRDDAFPSIAGAKETNIIMWKHDYNNKLDGNQRVLKNGENEEIRHLISSKEDVQKPAELIALLESVKLIPGFTPMQSSISVVKPYGLRTDIADNTAKYGLPALNIEKQSDSDLTLICGNGVIRYATADYPLPRTTGNEQKWKCFIPNAWGSFSFSKQYIGGSYAGVLVVPPGYICSETYLETKGFEDYDSAYKQAKYCMTKFCRALLFLNKTSLLCANAWGAVPLQDYSEDFWNGTVDEIDIALMDKYRVPQNIREFVNKNIQAKAESNIINYREVNEHGD